MYTVRVLVGQSQELHLLHRLPPIKRAYLLVAAHETTEEVVANTKLLAVHPPLPTPYRRVFEIHVHERIPHQSSIMKVGD